MTDGEARPQVRVDQNRHEDEERSHDIKVLGEEIRNAQRKRERAGSGGDPQVVATVSRAQMISKSSTQESPQHPAAPAPKRQEKAE